MSILSSVLDHPFIYRLGWVLLHSVWEGALVAVGFGLLRSGLRRRSANARYVSGCVALILLVLAPVATVLLGSSSGFTGTPARIVNDSATVSPTLIAFPAASSGSA